MVCAVKRGKGVLRPRKPSKVDLGRKSWRSLRPAVEGDAAVRNHRLSLSPRAGSRAQRQRRKVTGMEKKWGREAGDRVVLGLYVGQWRVQAQAERIGQRRPLRPLTGPLDGPRTGQPRAKNSHCEPSVQRRRALLEPSSGWRGPSRRRLRYRYLQPQARHQMRHVQVPALLLVVQLN